MRTSSALGSGLGFSVTANWEGAVSSRTFMAEECPATSSAGKSLPRDFSHPKEEKGQARIHRPRYLGSSVHSDKGHPHLRLRSEGFPKNKIVVDGLIAPLTMNGHPAHSTNLPRPGIPVLVNLQRAIWIGNQPGRPLGPALKKTHLCKNPVHRSLDLNRT